MPPREDSSVKTKNSQEEYDPGTISNSKEFNNERGRADPAVRTESAIGIQRELQLAFINISKDLWPMIQGVMERDAPRWLKDCCQDNYFSKYTYRGAKIPIGDELIFEDAQTSSSDGLKDAGFSSNAKHNTGEKLGSISSLHRSDESYNSRAPDSPSGSTGSSSVVSRGSDTARSIKSLMSLRSQKERQIP